VTVLEFQEELRKLALLAYPDLNNSSRDNIIRPIFIIGLQPGIKYVLKFREFSSFTEAVKTAKFVESQIFRDVMSAPMMNIETDSGFPEARTETTDYRGDSGNAEQEIVLQLWKCLLPEKELSREEA